MLSYVHAYMRFYHLYEGESQAQEQGLLNDNNMTKSKKYTNNSNNLIYRYDWLIDEDIQTIQNKIIDFVNSKKKDGMTSKGINNYIIPLQRFYRVNGIKGIDWDLVKSCRPGDVKKTQDREYNAEEVIAIEEKLAE